jgi:hypothetical protein
MKLRPATNFSSSLAPQSSRQKVGDTSKAFPLCGSTGQAVIEARIDYEVFPQRIRCGPQIPDRISVRQRLREVPYLARDGELGDRMRDRERLGKLRPPRLGLIVLLLRHQAIHVEVKTTQIVTQQDRRALDERAEVELRRRAGIEPPQVLARDRWPLVVARQNDCLHGLRRPLPAGYPKPPRRYCA